jgi:hypothetical protein
MFLRMFNDEKELLWKGINKPCAADGYYFRLRPEEHEKLM